MKMMKEKAKLRICLLIFAAFLSLIYLSTFEELYNLLQHNRTSNQLGENQTKIRTKWISMGLCWDENAKVHHKNNFPYSEAALRSISLWHRLTDARVIIQIFFKGEQPNKKLLNYKSKLEVEGALVYLNKTEPSIGCVLSAQISRLVSSYLEIIEEDDVIITADVDAFIMTNKILQPLKLDGKKLWLWRYDLALKFGNTFAMSFTAAYRNTWKEMIWYRGNLTEMFEHYMKIIKYKNTWWVDQHILSHGILSVGICSLPANNNLWKAVGIDPKTSKTSEAGCWAGSSRIYNDCNNSPTHSHRNKIIRYYGNGCKWWHFLPSESVQQLELKYREILEIPGDQGYAALFENNVSAVQP